MPDPTLFRVLGLWRWRLRFWWAWLPWVKRAYQDGYCTGWTDRRIGMRQDTDAAFDEWVSRLGE